MRRLFRVTRRRTNFTIIRILSSNNSNRTLLSNFNRRNFSGILNAQRRQLDHRRRRRRLPNRGTTPRRTIARGTNTLVLVGELMVTSTHYHARDRRNLVRRFILRGTTFRQRRLITIYHMSTKNGFSAPTNNGNKSRLIPVIMQHFRTPSILRQTRSTRRLFRNLFFLFRLYNMIRTRRQTTTTIFNARFTVRLPLSFLPVEIVRVVFFHFRVLFLRRLRNLFRLTLTTTTLTSRHIRHHHGITTGRNVRPFPRAPRVVNTLNSNQDMNITITVLTTFRPALFFRPMGGIRRNHQYPTLYTRLYISIPPNSKHATNPRHRRRLLLYHQGQLCAIQSTVRPTILPPFHVFFTFAFIFILLLCRFLHRDTETKGTSRVELFRLCFAFIFIFIFLSEAFIYFIPTRKLLHHVFIREYSYFRPYGANVLQLRRSARHATRGHNTIQCEGKEIRCNADLRLRHEPRRTTQRNTRTNANETTQM